MCGLTHPRVTTEEVNRGNKKFVNEKNALLCIFMFGTTKHIDVIELGTQNTFYMTHGVRDKYFTDMIEMDAVTP